MAYPVIKNKGTLSSVQKWITVRGKRYEQAAGAHTESEIKKIKAYNEKTYKGYKYIIVKSISENKPYHTDWGEQTFYWIYEREDK